MKMTEFKRIDSRVIKVKLTPPPMGLWIVSLDYPSKSADRGLFLRFVQGDGRFRRPAIRGHHEDISIIPAIPDGGY